MEMDRFSFLHSRKRIASPLRPQYLYLNVCLSCCIFHALLISFFSFSYSIWWLFSNFNAVVQVDIAVVSLVHNMFVLDVAYSKNVKDSVNTFVYMTTTLDDKHYTEFVEVSLALLRMHQTMPYVAPVELNSLTMQALRNREEFLDAEHKVTEDMLQSAPKISLIAADFNGDKRIDLALGLMNDGNGGLPLLLSTPDGKWVTHWHQNMPKGFVEGLIKYPERMVVSDVNDDHNMDITMFRSPDDQTVALSYGDGHWKMQNLVDVVDVRISTPSVFTDSFASQKVFGGKFHGALSQLVVIRPGRNQIPVISTECPKDVTARTDVTCRGPKTTPVVHDLCMGKPSCTIPAVRAVLGDGCPDKRAIRKLKVTAMCATPGRNPIPFVVSNASMHVAVLPDATLYTIMPPLISKETRKAETEEADTDSIDMDLLNTPESADEEGESPAKTELLSEGAGVRTEFGKKSRQNAVKKLKKFVEKSVQYENPESIWKGLKLGGSISTESMVFETMPGYSTTFEVGGMSTLIMTVQGQVGAADCTGHVDFHFYINGKPAQRYGMGGHVVEIDDETAQPLVFKQMRMVQPGTHTVELKAKHSGCIGVTTGVVMQVNQTQSQANSG